MFDHAWSRLSELVVSVIREASLVDRGLALLVLILVVAAIVTDSLLSRIQHSRRKTGITRRMVVKSIEGGYSLAPREYISRRLGLAGRPDAVVEENGFIIPVERKAFGKKPHDRDIAQLLVYLRLIEDLEGMRPPHGYLIIGAAAKRYKIDNTEARQKWLDEILSEMRPFLKAPETVSATPEPGKCASCPFHPICTKQLATGISLKKGKKKR